MPTLVYRYASHWTDYDDSNFWYRLKNHAQQHFLDVKEGENILSFTATPAQVKECCRLHGIDPCFINIVATDDLTPLQILEVSHAKTSHN